MMESPSDSDPEPIDLHQLDARVLRAPA